MDLAIFLVFIQGIVSGGPFIVRFFPGESSP